MTNEKIVKTFAVLLGTIMIFAGIGSFISQFAPFILIILGIILIIYGKDLFKFLKKKKKR